MGYSFGAKRTATLKNEIMKNFLKAIDFPVLLETLASHCQTPAGSDYLKIFSPEEDIAVIENRLNKTQELEKYITTHKTPSIPDSQYFIESLERARTKGDVLSGKELASLVRFLLEVVKLRQYLTPDQEIPSPFGEWLGRLHALPELTQSLQTKVSERGEVLDEASPELKIIRNRLHGLKGEVQNFYQSFLQKSETAEALQEKIVTEREGRLVVPVKRDHQSLVPGFVHGMSSSGATLFVEPREIVENNNRIKETLLAEDEEIRKIPQGGYPVGFDPCQ